MKIFNVENDKEKVYVQMNDLAMLTRMDIPIPASIFEKVFSDVVIIDDTNRNDFVEFTEPDDIDFFNSLEWILDYKLLSSRLTEQELKEKQQEILNDMNDIAEKYNSIPDNEKVNYQELVQKHELLGYKMYSISQMLGIRQGNIQIPFPIVPDSAGFSCTGDDEFKYEIRASLDPNKLLLFRRDGKKLSDEDRIPPSFLQMGMSIAIMQRSEKNPFVGDCEISRYLTEDNRYLVTEFKIKSYDNGCKEQEEVQDENQVVKHAEVQETKRRGIKEFVKRRFNKNKN